MENICASSEIATSKGKQSAKYNYEAPVDRWPCKALQCWLKARALTYSGLQKAKLTAEMRFLPFFYGQLLHAQMTLLFFGTLEDA